MTKLNGQIYLFENDLSKSDFRVVLKILNENAYYFSLASNDSNRRSVSYARKYGIKFSDFLGDEILQGLVDLEAYRVDQMETIISPEIGLSERTLIYTLYSYNKKSMELLTTMADIFFTPSIEGVAFLDEKLRPVLVSVAHEEVSYAINYEIARKMIDHCQGFNFTTREIDKNSMYMQFPEFSLDRVNGYDEQSQTS